MISFLSNDFFFFGVYFVVMPIDKSWTSKSRNTIEYSNGLNIFLDFAFEHGNGRVIKCPCSKCGFNKWQTRDAVLEHLTCRPFPENYKTWYMHGEGPSVSDSMAGRSANVVQDFLESQNPMEDMLNDAFGFVGNDVNDFDKATEEDGVQANMMRDEGNIDFDALLKENNQPLYDGCTKYSKLSFMLKLYHIKCMCRMSDKAMTLILELLKDAFEHAKFPSSFYEAKNSISKLGLNYVKIPACPKDCMLYWGEENEDLEECKRCKMSKWKDKNKKQYAKILRYFPLKPRLQRLFMSPKTSDSMTWHASVKNQDELMRHPREILKKINN